MYPGWGERTVSAQELPTGYQKCRRRERVSVIPAYWHLPLPSIIQRGWLLLPGIVLYIRASGWIFPAILSL